MRWPEFRTTADRVETRVAYVHETAAGLFLVPVVQIGEDHFQEFGNRIAAARERLPELEALLRHQYQLPPLAEWDALLHFSICYQLSYGHALNHYDRFRPYLAVPRPAVAATAPADPGSGSKPEAG